MDKITAALLEALEALVDAPPGSDAFVAARHRARFVIAEVRGVPVRGPLMRSSFECPGCHKRSDYLMASFIITRRSTVDPETDSLTCTTCGTNTTRGEARRPAGAEG